MARIRTIKPDYYADDELSEVSIWARFIFPGLWQQSDRDGRLLDSPKRLKREILPYDNADMDALLQELHEAGFIHRYTHEGERYIWIPEFRKHQRITGLEAETPSSHPVSELEKQRRNTGGTSETQDGNSEDDRKGKEGNSKGKDRETSKDVSSGKPRKKRSVRFITPSAQQVADQCVAINLPKSQGKLFYDHHMARGWTLARGVKMKDWQAALRTWKANYETGKFTGDGKPPPGMVAPVLTPDEYQAELRRAQGYA